MNKNLYAILLCFFSFAKAIAQDTLPQAFEIKTDTVLYNRLPNAYWQILEDKKGEFNFNDVSKLPVANRFHYYQSETSQRDDAIHSYWFRYVLKNTMAQDAKICLGDTLYSLFPFFTPENEQSDFYLINHDGIVTHQANGFLTPWSTLNGLKEERLVPVVLKPGEQIAVFRRIYNPHKFSLYRGYSFWVGFSSTEKIMQQVHSRATTKYFTAIENSFFFGVLVFAGLFILFFFAIVREKVYLFFSLYLFSVALGRVNIFSEMYEVLFRDYPLLYIYLFQFLWPFAIFFLILFISHLLNTKQLFPRWNKFIVILNSITILSYLLYSICLLSNNPTTLLGNINLYGSIILNLSIPVTFFMSAKWLKSNKILTFIVLPLQSLWSIGYITFTLGGLEENVWHKGETILLSCLVISFSWILLHRFVDMKKQIVQKELEKEIEKSKLIESQKIELEDQVTKRTAELKQSLENLKATQAQLIQSEKMASLGELTAGIAHEIQNPLNFMNNFSEVNSELIEEAGQEIDKGNIDEVKIILNDIKGNEQKINLHGKRADAIVKGMLQHSQTSTGQKEPTDINKLADDYLRLSYQGIRAKDKTFNTTLKTDFDESIGNIPIIPRDIGRVLLNLYNNAFYAVNQKAESNKQKAESEVYEPTISVSTKKLDNTVEIKVSDNGNGIPQKIIDKIFQPFFTTKPTGQGTGLGLSLSYDIIKAHGGEIKVETKEGEGSIFIIDLTAY